MKAIFIEPGINEYRQEHKGEVKIKRFNKTDNTVIHHKHDKQTTP